MKSKIPPKVKPWQPPGTQPCSSLGFSRNVMDSSFPQHLDVTKSALFLSVCSFLRITQGLFQHRMKLIQFSKRLVAEKMFRDNHLGLSVRD